MTLHWWMHWFWVTANFAIIFGAPSITTTTTTTTTEEEIYQNRETIKPMFVTKISPSPSTEIKISISSTMIPFYPNNNNNNNSRNAKAIYSNEPSRKKNNGNLAGPDVQKQSSILSSKPDKYRHTTSNYQFLPTISTEFDDKNLSMRIPEEFEMQNDSPGDEQEDSVQIKTIKKTEFLWIESTTRPKNNHDKYDDLTVLPLGFKGEEAEEEEEETEVNVVVVNKSTINNAAGNKEKVSFSRQTINKSENLVFVSPSVSPIFQASIEKLNRNEDRFSRNFESVVEAEDRSFNAAADDDNDGGNYSRENGFTTFDIAAIAGSCLAMFVLISTMASFGFLMYRRKYLNPPQTLNSDKCSNPDSSGYIDDSTIRDNSEEMYSLDNDSFLNSLEAMTIQNYWTDSVKHTKL